MTDFREAFVKHELEKHEITEDKRIVDAALEIIFFLDYVSKFSEANKEDGSERKTRFINGKWWIPTTIDDMWGLCPKIKKEELVSLVQWLEDENIVNNIVLDKEQEIIGYSLSKHISKYLISSK